MCDRSKPSPWIETLILNYGTQGESSSSSGQLQAHVIGVDRMSESQAQGCKGLSGLLVLSDGVLKIPAILTRSAWKQLQEQEDRECFSSLVNTTVCVQDYRVRFHMALEQNKCRFFLSVGELATTATGQVKVNAPCCTSISSVRMKICRTWEALLGSQRQRGFDLSDLLGEWQHDCLQDVVEHVQQRVMLASCPPVSPPQPSTSGHASVLAHPDTSSATSWDVDRVRFKGVKCFSVPVKCLLVPGEDAQQLQTPPGAGNRTASPCSAASKDRKRDLPQVPKYPETTKPSVDDAEGPIAMPAVTERGHVTDVERFVLHEDVPTQMIDSDSEILSNPWDIFPPPCVTSSSSDASPEATPTNSRPNTATSTSDHVAVSTGMQPLHGLTESQLTSEHSKGEHSYFPPYQKRPRSTGLPATASSSASASVSAPEPRSRPSNLSSATGQHCAHRARLSASCQERDNLEEDTVETIGRKSRNAKRKRHEPATLVEEQKEEAQISGVPPSWLLDTRPASDAEDSSRRKGGTVATVLSKTPTVHSDGRLFSYSYQVSRQNLQDFSQFRVAESLLLWAVKYLVPKLTDDPCNASGTPDVTEDT